MAEVKKDDFGRRFSDAVPWRTASSLADGAELTALWLEGRSTYLPMYADDKPAEETQPWVAALASINRAGFVTDGSQPGVPLSDAYPQRAFLTGYCDESTADRLDRALARTELVVVTFGSGALGEASIPVTLHNGQPCTWLGRTDDLLDPEQFEFSASESNPVYVEALRNATHLQLFDPVWGRPDYLFQSTLTALAS